MRTRIVVPFPAADSICSDAPPSAARSCMPCRPNPRPALLASPAADELTDERRARRAQRIEALCASMDVLCVAAPDYLSLIDDFADMAWLKDQEATNVPAFRSSLAAKASAPI